jgi:hypothetical protein
MPNQISAHCPVTGKPVATGVECDSESFLHIPFLVATENLPGLRDGPQLEEIRNPTD